MRSLRAQFKQSVVGYGWLLLNPLTQVVTLTFVFSTIFQTPSQGEPFVLFLCVGLFPWIFFSTATASSTESIVGAAGLITTVYFPRDFLVISAILIRLVDFMVALVILVAALLYYGKAPEWTLAWTPVLFLLQFLFIVGLSLPLAALNLFFHDVRHLVGILLNLWFFFTPVFYSPDIVPERYRIIYDLNPMARFIGSYRETVLHGHGPPLTSVFLAAATTLVTLTIGYYLFRRMETRFADRV